MWTQKVLETRCFFSQKVLKGAVNSLLKKTIRKWEKESSEYVQLHIPLGLSFFFFVCLLVCFCVSMCGIWGGRGERNKKYCCFLTLMPSVLSLPYSTSNGKKIEKKKSKNSTVFLKNLDWSCREVGGLFLLELLEKIYNFYLFHWRVLF